MKRTNLLYLITFFIAFIRCSDSEDDIFFQQSDVLVINGNTYETVQIGDQIWMAENLREKTGDMGSFQMIEFHEGWSWQDYDYYEYQMCYYNDDENNIYQGYGAFYNYNAAMAACPEGWHLPSDEDWKTLEKTIGLSKEEVNLTSFRGSDQGNRLKSTTRWNGKNSVGFNALPAGFFAGGYAWRDQATLYWSSTEYGSDKAYYRMINTAGNIYRDAYEKSIYFLSVRYVKN